MLCSLQKTVIISCYLYFCSCLCFQDKVTHIFMLFKDLGNMKNDSWGLNVDRLNETQIGPYIKLKSPSPPSPCPLHHPEIKSDFCPDFQKCSTCNKFGNPRKAYVVESTVVVSDWFKDKLHWTNISSWTLKSSI